MTGNSALLDTSIVVRHFREATAVAEKLAGYQESGTLVREGTLSLEP